MNWLFEHKKIALFFLGIVLLGAVVWGAAGKRESSFTASVEDTLLPSSNSSLKKREEIPLTKILTTDYHVFQTFNNCAPAALSMALSYYGINAGQETLAADLRPYNNLTGKNDDKSTPPDELAKKAEEYGLIPYFRAHGSIKLIQQFIAHDMPVVMRTLLYADKDFAHYRVVKGYDDITKEIIQDDSFEGKNLRYSYDDFLDLWQPFNYGYLVLVPSGKRGVAENILGEELDPALAWEKALERARFEIDANPSDLDARFNLVTALYYTGDYTGATNVFETIEDQLPMHTLWYQIEPIQAYFELGNYERVFELSEKIFSDGNIAFSELYLLRGKSYLAQGNTALAKQEFEKAVLYNKNYTAAAEALLTVGS